MAVMVAAASGTGAEAAPESRAILPTPQLTAYFEHEVQSIADECAAEMPATKKQWPATASRLRKELFYMLGLDPQPERTDLKATVTGTLERDGVTVERLHFQPVPRFYAAANLYRPTETTTSLPGILYVCGHKKVAEHGISYGNKTGYQQHGAWFARNGYVCLVVDTFELGEIGGVHRGTHSGMGKSEPRWWWNSRGYTPAGVEAWTGIRALDYLCSRPEVDTNRIGVTGRSGGGGYSWTISALDDRVSVLVPVAGITDLRNQVIDGAVDGHCDCMFYVNAFRWDFWKLAALSAPRPTLLVNTDADRIFPLDGVLRLHSSLDRVHSKIGKSSSLGLAILPGPHGDTQDQQVAAFRWINLHLLGTDPPIDAARPLFTPQELKVFDAIPADQINTQIDERFVPQAKATVPSPPAEWRNLRDGWKRDLRKYCFAGWPTSDSPVDLRRISDMTATPGLAHWRFESQPGVELPLVLQSGKGKPAKRCVLRIVDSIASTSLASGTTGDIVAYFCPRPMPEMSKRDETRVRRRFMMIGQTLDGMRVWDIRMAIRALRSIEATRDLPLVIEAAGSAAVNAIYAAIFEKPVAGLVLTDPPATHMNGPDYLNVLRVLDIPQATALAAETIPVTLRVQDPAAWLYVRDTAARLSWREISIAGDNRQ